MSILQLAVLIRPAIVVKLTSFYQYQNNAMQDIRSRWYTTRPRLAVQTDIYSLDVNITVTLKQSIKSRLAQDEEHWSSNRKFVAFNLSMDDTFSFCNSPMLTTSPRGTKNLLSGTFSSFIYIMYFHFHGIRSRVEQGAPWLQ